MLAAEGVVIDDFQDSGWIRVHGEVWKAESNVPLKSGDHVQVTAVDGLVLKVQPKEN